MNHPIALHQTTLTYPDGTTRLTAVDRADLEVDAGELVFLVGPSGSGKSSLLALAAGLTVPDSGSVRIAGRELTTMDRGARTRWRLERIGMVFQQANLLDALTAREQLTVMASLHGERPAAYRRKADDLLEAVGLAEVRDRYPAQLSGGQRQRVAIARALVGDPSVLLVDEPTAALDHERGEAVMELLRAATVEHDLATLVVTHDLGRLRPSDRVMRCEDGVITPDTVPV